MYNINLFLEESKITQHNMLKIYPQNSMNQELNDSLSANRLYLIDSVHDAAVRELFESVYSL